MQHGINEFDNLLEDILNVNSDLVLLDINLPNVNGEYICKELRKKSNVPIVMLTSVDNDLDELLCMNYGADDYITKPFNIQILLAKISAILKRSNNAHNNQNKIDCKEFVLNVAKNSIEKDGKEVELTKNEFKIIYFLYQKVGEIVLREDLMRYLWDSESFIDDNTLTVNITRIRNKLSSIGLENILQTKRGQGYILNLD